MRTLSWIMLGLLPALAASAGAPIYIEFTDQVRTYSLSPKKKSIAVTFLEKAAVYSASTSDPKLAACLQDSARKSLKVRLKVDGETLQIAACSR